MVDRPKDVPIGASRMFYLTGNSSGIIWWWQNTAPRTKTRWYWVAAGNNGEEETERAAIDRAKRWIRDGK